VYDEPDWSSLSLLELLEKAQEFAKKAYSSSTSTFAFLDRSLDKLPQGTKGGAEMAELLGKAQLASKTLADVQQNRAQIISLLSQ
jgi:proline racemase